MRWFLEVVKNYAGPSGRAHRTEYWMFTLFCVIIYIVLVVIAGVVFGPPFIALVFNLALLVPYIAVTVRRLHDTN